MYGIDKRILNYLVIIALTLLTFLWTFWIFHKNFLPNVIITVAIVRLIASTLILGDYSLSWSKSTQKTFLIKSAVYLAAFAVYMPILYRDASINFFVSELFVYLFLINFLMYGYYYYINKGTIVKSKHVVIYGAGKAGLKLEEEFRNSQYKVEYFVDDAESLHKRSIDTVQIISKKDLKEKLENTKFDLLLIAMPSVHGLRIKEIYHELSDYFYKIQILPTLDSILQDQPFSAQLKEISLTELLARHPHDLNQEVISSFLRNKTILITGAGGSIGSEIVRQCIKFNANKLILLDHCEYNLYRIEQEIIDDINAIYVMQSIINKEQLQKTFEMYEPQIVIHAAAYKHVPMVESNIEEAILNNVIGTKNCIDLSIEYEVEKFILISTDKAVRPTNVMGATKRICELYAQNADAKKTEIVAVRFGNVLGSSGSVVPKFREQIKKGHSVTVTHPDVTRYFMLISEACELVLQTGAIGKGGEIFILDMGEPVRIVDLAKKMIELSGRNDIEIEFTGLRPGEKLYEELLIDESDMRTQCDSITIATPTTYPIETLNQDIIELLNSDNKIEQLKAIVPEFDHRRNK